MRRGKFNRHGGKRKNYAHRQQRGIKQMRQAYVERGDAPMKKRNFTPISSATYDHRLHKGELNEQESKTVPDQAKTVRDILIQGAQGIANVTFANPVYNNETYIPDPRTLDLVDVDEMRRSNERTQENIKIQVKADIKAKKLAKTAQEAKTPPTNEEETSE